MTKTIKLLATGSCLALAILGAFPALAAGTTAGSTITNTVTVNFQVGGVSQTASTGSNAITVDRKVAIRVQETGTATTSVVPGQTTAVTTFTVTNDTNATIDIGLTAAQLAGGTASHGGTDNFDVTGLGVFVDSNANGTYDAGTDTAVTYLDEVAADGVRTVFVVGGIGATRVNGDVAGVNLQGQAREGGAAATQGTVITATAGANTAGIDTVLFDTVGVVAGDIANDGKASDDDDFTVSAAILSVFKQSRIVSDPVNGTTNPKMIPGATIEYCIVVANGSGGAAATSVNISDPLPAQTTYDATYGIFQSGTYTGSPPTGTCNLDGAAGGSFAAGTVSGTLGTVNPGTTRTLYFRATIN